MFFAGIITAVFRGIAERAAEANKPQEGDYEKDGLLYCGVCHTPKQTILPKRDGFPLSGEKVFCACACAERRQQRIERAQKAERIQALREQAFSTKALERDRARGDQRQTLQRKPLIVTTNLTAEQIVNPADLRMRRIYSRMYELCVPYECKGEDLRRKALRDDYKTLRNLLEIEPKQTT